MASNADAFAQTLAPVLDEVRSQGITTLRQIAEALNDHGMLTRRGGEWHVSTVGIC